MKLKPDIAKKAKEKERVRKSKKVTLPKSAKSLDTREELAKVAKVSHDTPAKETGRVHKKVSVQARTVARTPP